MIRLGILACLLAGCATQPTGWSPPPTPGARAAANDPIAAIEATDLRIGLEFLPPDDRMPEVADVRAEPVRRRATTERVPTTADRDPDWDLARDGFPIDAPRRTELLADEHLAAIRDPVARETMHFCRDLINTDRQRVIREIGVPFFDFQDQNDERGELLTSDRRLLEDREQWCQEHGVRMLNRPLRLLAKRLPIMAEVELAIQDFRKRHVPLTEPYQKVHGDHRKLGRLSMRLHARQFDDPVEVVYIHRYVRVGSSRMQGKLSIDMPLSNKLHVSFRARSNYETGDNGLRTDLIYQATPRMSVRVAAGDNMDFLSTSSMYSLFESPMDGSAGILLYAVHTF